MKKFFSVALAVLFIFLTGCKSIGEYFSEVKNYITEKGDAAYDNISEKVKDASDGIVTVKTKSAIDKKEIVNIKPQAVKDTNGSLSAYKLLTDDQKKLYSIMLTIISTMELKKVDITKYSKGDGFSDAVVAHRALMYDRPDLFWAPKTFSLLSVEGQDDKYLCFKDHYAKDDGLGFYGITENEKDKMKSELDKVVARVVKDAAAYSSDFEKELYFHDYICENTVYDNESAENLNDADPNSMTAYGALVSGSAICEGYSKAMQLLCLKAGISCGTVYGEHQDVPHMWNVIEIGGDLYYLDVTFDDSSSAAILHSYFNVTKSEISKDHAFDGGFSSKKEYDSRDSFNFYCDDYKSTSQNYYQQTGAYIEDDLASAVEHIAALAQSGKTKAELKNRTSMSLSRAFDLLCKKAHGTVSIKHCYRYEETNILIVEW